jgi:hypothetical protein
MNTKIELSAFGTPLSFAPDIASESAKLNAVEKALALVSAVALGYLIWQAIYSIEQDAVKTALTKSRFVRIENGHKDGK